MKAFQNLASRVPQKVWQALHTSEEEVSPEGEALLEVLTDATVELLLLQRAFVALCVWGAMWAQYDSLLNDPATTPTMWLAWMEKFEKAENEFFVTHPDATFPSLVEAAHTALRVCAQSPSVLH